MYASIVEDGQKVGAVDVIARLIKAADSVNEKYDSHIEVYYPSIKSASQVSFTLKPALSVAEDSENKFRKVSKHWDNPRRVFGLCFHAHLAFFTELYRDNPGTKLRSAMAKWDSMTDFCVFEDICRIGEQNIGSQMYPVGHEDSCYCADDDTLWDGTWNSYYELQEGV